MNILNWFSQKREKALREQLILIIGGVCQNCNNIYCLSRRVNPNFGMTRHTCTKCSLSDLLAFQYFLTQEILRQVREQKATTFNNGSWPVLVQKMDDGYIVIFAKALIPSFQHGWETSNNHLQQLSAKWYSSIMNDLLEPRLARGLAAQFAGYSNVEVADYMASTPKTMMFSELDATENPSSKVTLTAPQQINPLSEALSVTNASGKLRKSDLYMVNSGREIVQGGDDSWNVPCYQVRLYS